MCIIRSEDKKRKKIKLDMSNKLPEVNVNMTHNRPVQLIQSDLQEIDSTTITDSSIDLIFTDPYNREWLPSYEPLGKPASRVLKERGTLVMFAVQYALPQVFDYMKNSGLKSWWAIAVVKHNASPSFCTVNSRPLRNTYPLTATIDQIRDDIRDERKCKETLRLLKSIRRLRRYTNIANVGWSLYCCIICSPTSRAYYSQGTSIAINAIPVGSKSCAS